MTHRIEELLHAAQRKRNITKRRSLLTVRLGSRPGDIVDLGAGTDDGVNHPRLGEGPR